MVDQSQAQYDGIDVEILDRESYRGTDVVQIDAVDEATSLTDPSGNPPWVEADEVDNAE